MRRGWWCCWAPALIAAAGVSLAMLPHREAAPAAARGGAERARQRRLPWLTGNAAAAATVSSGCRASSRRRAAPRAGRTRIAASAATNALAALVREAAVACRITGAGRPRPSVRDLPGEAATNSIAPWWRPAGPGRLPANQSCSTPKRRREPAVSACGHRLPTSDRASLPESRCKMAADDERRCRTGTPCATPARPAASPAGRANGLTTFRLTIAIALQHKGFLPRTLARTGWRTLPVKPAAIGGTPWQTQPKPGSAAARPASHPSTSSNCSRPIATCC